MPDDFEALWLLGGDFNCPPESDEISLVKRHSFMDASPNKGKGNKTSGFGNPPSHTVDYLFAHYLNAQPGWQQTFDAAVQASPEPDLSFKVSDHYPTIAYLPIPDVSDRPGQQQIRCA